ncbi:MAG: mycofactocin-associated electron transfer flavoprotein alpha subunit, partial [Sciscionella sp.]
MNGHRGADLATTPDMIAVLVVRDGILPLGAQEAVAEAGGDALLVGSSVTEAAAQLQTASRIQGWETTGFAPGGWAQALAPHLRERRVLLLPASVDGRDLAPRLAAALGRPLLAGCSAVSPHRAVLLRWGSRVSVTVEVSAPMVATLQPGIRGIDPHSEIVDAEVDIAWLEGDLDHCAAVPDARTVEVLQPDPETVDLAEASRIFCAGAGLGGAESAGRGTVDVLGRVAAALGASLGATRVVTDAGWAEHQRQIGTT